jgi:hypothetical protein
MGKTKKNNNVGKEEFWSTEDVTWNPIESGLTEDVAWCPPPVSDEKDDLDDSTKESIIKMLRKIVEEEGLDEEDEEYNTVKIDKEPSLSELSNTELTSLYEMSKILYEEAHNYVAIDSRDIVHKSKMGQAASMRKKLLDEMWVRINKYNKDIPNA